MTSPIETRGLANNAPLTPELAQAIRELRLVVFDFDGVFTDNTVYVLEDGREAVRCSRSDGLGLRRLEQVGIMPFILSTESNPVVAKRARKLAVRCASGSSDKLASLRSLWSEYAFDAAVTAYVGNDINDLDCLQAVRLPIVVRDAHHEVIPCARYQTHAAGGMGAVREICDLIFHIRRPTTEPIYERA